MKKYLKLVTTATPQVDGAAASVYLLSKQTNETDKLHFSSTEGMLWVNGVAYGNVKLGTVTGTSTAVLTIGKPGETNGVNELTFSLSGHTHNYVSPSSTFYIGTTQIAHNRASAAQSLTGINGLTSGTNTALTLTANGTGGLNLVTGAANIILKYNNADASTVFLNADMFGPHASATSLDLGRAAYPWDITYTKKVISGNGSDLTIQSPSGKSIIFNTNGATEVARISSSGYFGIGATNPGSKLHVVGTTRLNGTVAIGSASGSQCTLSYNTTNKCLDFIFN